MTDLTGAGLALATARVMGLRGVYEEDDSVWRGDGTVHGTEEWRPDLGGAAAWEVLEWVRREGYEVMFADQDGGPRLVWCCIDAWDSCVGTRRGAYGPTGAIALCRAVVALGEAG